MSDTGVSWRPNEFDVENVAGMLGHLRELMELGGEEPERHFAPGLSEDEIRSTLQPIGLDLHADLVEWFKWSAGPFDNSYVRLTYDGVQAPVHISTVVDRMRSNDGSFGYDYELYRTKVWVPFLSMAAMDCSHSDLRGAIVMIDAHDDCFSYLRRFGIEIWYWIALREENLLQWNSNIESADSFDQRSRKLAVRFQVGTLLPGSETRPIERF